MAEEKSESKKEKKPKAQADGNAGEKKHGKAKTLAILAAKLGRAVYAMLRRKEAFDAAMFWSN